MEIKIMASAAIIDKNKLLVLKRSSEEKFLSGYWTIVGGKYEDGDASIEEAVKREVMEETGLSIAVVRPIDIEEFTREDRPNVRAVEITYLCSTEHGEKITLDAREHDAYAWVDESDAAKLDPVSDLTKRKIEKIFASIKENK
jgi:8-oxo-dGTP pyrophosphatase MutT (NUDIX family)